MISRKPAPLFALVSILILSYSYSSAAPAKPSMQGSAQAQPITKPQVERLDPAANDIIPAKPVFQKVASGFVWTEGPVWVPAGYLLFSDIPGNSIEKLSADDQLSVFIHPSGYEGSTPYGGPEPGSNGLTLDRRGRLTVAGHARRNVWRLESLDPKAQITVLADSYEGKRLNSPNDLVYKSDGSLYFTDPPYGLPSQSDSEPTKELKINGVYRIPGALDQKPGDPPAREKLQLLVSDLPSPNGIAFSPDEKYLYVDNSDVQRKVWMRYRVQPDGTLADGKVFCDATSDTRPGVPDGMKVDQKGNVYGAGPGGVWIISPEGKHLATLDIPEKVGNLAWGGVNGRTLYIAASGNIYRVMLKIRGLRPQVH